MTDDKTGILGRLLGWNNRPQGRATVESCYMRGTVMLSMVDAYRRCLRLPTAPDEPRIVWGGLPMPERYSDGHFCALGATRSGKTVTLRLLMQSVLPHIRRGHQWRALVYDPKNEFRSVLSGMGLRCPVISLNPFDARSAAWDMARDINEPALAAVLAALLIEDRGQGSDPFWTESARNLLAAVIKALILQAPLKWTLRDIVLTLSRIDRAKRLLAQTPETRTEYYNHFEAYEARGGEDRVAESIKHTVAASMNKLVPIAAAWAHSTMMVSLTDWVNGDYILHLGRDENYPALDVINRVLFRRASQLLVKGAQRSKRRTWIFIDEAQFAGNLMGLSDLLTTGSSFGVRVCMASQTVEGFRAVYEKDRADSIIGQCANKAFFRTDSPDTAQYVASVMGNVQELVRGRQFSKSKSTSSGGPGGMTNGESTSETTTEQVVTNQSVMPEQVLRLYPADQERFYGYYQIAPVGTYEGWVHHAPYLKPKGVDPDFVPRPEDQLLLAEWSREDEQRLGKPLLRLLVPEMFGEAPSVLTHVDPPPDDKPHHSHLDDIDLPPPPA